MRMRHRILAVFVSVGFCQMAAVAQSPPASTRSVGHSGITAAASSQSQASPPTTGLTESVYPKTTAPAGLTIVPTFDSSITTSPNAAAIEAMINAAIGVLEAQFADPITVSIYFRYSSTQPDGQPASLANSDYGLYLTPYATYVNALKADSKTPNDATALNNLPASALASNVKVSTALGRALGMNTPGFIASDGTTNKGGIFDGIVTFNSTQPFQFNRTGGITAGNYDAQRAVEHEMDEILGLASVLPSAVGTGSTSAVFPEDLFRYAAPGSISLTTDPSASAYFSIDGGVTSTVGFSQDGSGDYGDWLSPSCAAEAITPLVQYASVCPGTAADVSATSPEGMALDVIGYDLRAPGLRTAQTITFAALSNRTLPVAPFALSATASSGLPVAFNSTTTPVCTVSNSTLTIVGTGTCSISANQAGNATYAPATPVTQSFVVSLFTGTAQTITFGPLSNVPLGTKPFAITATASSGLAVSFTSATTGVCTVSGNTVTIVAAGFCSITASQPGNSTYATATPVTRTFTVSSPLQLITVAPCRIMDTRNANGPLGGPFVAAGTTRTVPIPSSACGIPASAAAYSLNFTVVPRAGTLGYLSVWPAGQTQPLVSTLNSPDGSVLANAAIVPAGAAGAIDAYATNDTDLIVDINGYFVPPAAASLQFYPLTPCRILDTRNANGTFGGPSIAGNTSRSFPMPSSPCGAPARAAAYSLNVTVVPHGALGYLTAWPTGQAQPFVSTLNSFDGTILANAAIVPAGNAGSASFFASDATDLVVDINGYFAPPGSGGLNFYPVTPCRLADTRNAGGVMGANTTGAFPLAGSCGLPGTPAAQAYSLNMTVVPQGPLGYLTTWPAGGTQPGVSTLNASKGLVVANASIVPAGGAGSIDVYVTNTTNVVIDTNGYFGP